MRSDRLPLLLDVDGVVLNFVQFYLDQVYLVTGKRIKPADIDSWNLEAACGMTQLEATQVNIRINKPGMAHGIEPLPNAVQAVHELREYTPIVFVTAPWAGSRTWASDRKNHLRAIFGRDTEVISTDAHTKRLVCGSTLVDDKVSTVIEWSEFHNKPAVLWSAPYNENLTGVPPRNVMRMNRWDSLLRHVRGGWL